MRKKSLIYQKIRYDLKIYAIIYQNILCTTASYPKPVFQMLMINPNTTRESKPLLNRTHISKKRKENRIERKERKNANTDTPIPRLKRKLPTTPFQNLVKTRG
jgi:hypothetical protein